MKIKAADDHSTEWWYKCPRCKGIQIRTKGVQIEKPNIVVSLSCFNVKCGPDFFDVYSPLLKVMP